MRSVGGVGNALKRPYTVSVPSAPTYTFPSATVGTTNFTASPAWSLLLAAWVLSQSLFARLVASKAYRTAGPVASPFVPLFEESTAQIMGFEVPVAESPGVAPGNGKLLELREAGDVLNCALVVLRTKACKGALAADMYKVFCQNNPDENIPCPIDQVWTA